MVDKPTNIGDFLEQLRPPIIRSEGATASERYLAKLADRTFLNLWSYPNPYRSQKLAGAGDGKEICDLLVVCDPHILIFSEKNITWTNKSVDVAWSRWCRRAVFDAAAQLKGAERWLSEFPDRIFLDKLCEVPFPLALPAPERRRVHRIVVARGAKEAGRKFFDGGLGTFVVLPSLKGNYHTTPGTANFMPFAIGDIEPAGDFVHVFDDVSLDIVMSELDTITDLTEYLDKRAAFIRSGRLASAHGEEDLLAYYAIRINDHGDHDFTPPESRTWEEVGSLAIEHGNWTRYVTDPRYKAKKLADETSYAWDRLIESFTGHLLGGTSIVLEGHTYSLTNSEIAVRHMALQKRFLRRSHSQAILSALEIGRSTDVFFRAMLSPAASKQHETGFFFMTLKYLKWMDDRGGYERYRQMRTFYIQTYAQALLMKHPHLRQVIGIAMEPPGQGRGSSEDIIFAEQTDWTEEDRDQSREDCANLNIMGQMKETPYHGEEFPEVAFARPRPLKGNRKQRRAMAARNRRRK
ncbi:hypothetical protein ACC786_32355 [Rhizobium ruizarguesonis]|uniref:hypothetical protein n=1 Tax=Rhizobium leguminosarum TaxID=384 RepID=UPI00103D5506|nr:hypothetical protein [Rhizobium leguminosarum]MBY5494309.1 hypothetical protein [Rhizobium leguminosarum]TBZ40408.1 hypothetical protein E0H44_24180 [Rhizobium leguminosarum bv. viciae]TCA08864.1 hypothetical protein E0H68_27270 [Rhizobium leguminosarum bv. viciae]TCA19592.1 hypothetical protein E0H67_25610 [Rhizobium leguminosarum bv. viciae]